MAKLKTVFVCTNCGYNSARWEGKCNSCGQWNTLQEDVQVLKTKQETKKAHWNGDSQGSVSKALPLSQVEGGERPRLISKDEELNRVLGGGLVVGSLILVGGEPGVGKSTLLLQNALISKHKVLYVSGEESAEQIKMRAQRLSPNQDNTLVYTETNIIKVLKEAKKIEPAWVIIDSIQTVTSPHVDSTPGTVSQIRECTAELQRFAKETNIPVLIVGHITKEGSIAGPKLLEHIVDVVLQFEGDQNYSYRILRTLKNRFGSTDEIGIYEMQSGGLREVSNPSELLLSQIEEDLSGSSVAATIEGMRPILIETQALVSPAIYGTPQRSATGFDLRRLSMLLAVLEKRCGLPFGQNDVFLNMAGGLKVSDPSIDLSIVTSLISSLEDIPVNKKICFAGEVGLSGEIRAVNRIEQRIQEADRLGFSEIYVSKYNAKGLDMGKFGLRISQVAKLDQLLESIFG